MIWKHSYTLVHNPLAFDKSAFDAALAQGSQRGPSAFALDVGLVIDVPKTVITVVARDSTASLRCSHFR